MCGEHIGPGDEAFDAEEFEKPSSFVVDLFEAAGGGDKSQVVLEEDLEPGEQGQGLSGCVFE